MSWLARALVFSGRPDPTWPLTPEDERRLLEAWSSLVSGADTAGGPPAKLGYRGVEVLIDSRRRWVAAGGVVIEIADGARTARRDPQLTIERLVLATAPPGTLPPGSSPA